MKKIIIHFKKIINNKTTQIPNEIFQLDIFGNSSDLNIITNNNRFKEIVKESLPLKNRFLIYRNFSFCQFLLLLHFLFFTSQRTTSQRNKK